MPIAMIDSCDPGQPDGGKYLHIKRSHLVSLDLRRLEHASGLSVADII